jgi:hypothetical protein
MPAAEEDIKKLKIQIAALKEPLENFRSAIRSIQSVFNAMAQVIDKNIKLENESVHVMDKANDILQKLNQTEHSRIQLLIAQRDQQIQALEAAKKLTDATDEMQESFTKAQQAIRKNTAKELVRGFSKSTGGSLARGMDFVKNLKDLRSMARAIGEVIARIGMVRSAIAATGIGAIILLAIAMFEQLMGRLKDAAQASKSFAGSTMHSQIGIMTLTGSMLKWNAWATTLGVSMEEIIKTTDILVNSYALQAQAATRFGVDIESYQDAVMGATIDTLSMGKAMGMTQDAIAKLMVSWALLGEDLRQSPAILAHLANMANDSGLNVTGLTTSLASMTNANMFATGSLMKTARSLAGFSKAIMESNNALLNGANKAAMAERAVTAMADAASKLDIPTIMAFGGAMEGFSGTMDQLLQQAAGMDRMEIFKRYQKQVEATAPTGQKMLAKTILAQHLGIQDLNTAMTTSIGVLQGQEKFAEDLAKDMKRANDRQGELQRLSFSQTMLLNGILDQVIKIANALTGTILSPLFLATKISELFKDGQTTTPNDMTRPATGPKAAGMTGYKE